MRIRPAAIAAFFLCIAAPALPAEKSDLHSAVRLIRVPQGGIQPQAAVDDKGVIHLVYFTGEPRQGDLFYVRSSDSGAAFSPPLRVNSQPGSAIAAGTIRGGQIALGKNGRVHVAWNGSGIARPQGPLNPEAGQHAKARKHAGQHGEAAKHSEAGQRGMPMLYARLDDTGQAFEPQRNLMQRSFGLDGGGAVAADHDERVQFVCKLARLPETFVVRDIPLESNFPAAGLSDDLDVNLPLLR